MLNPRQCRSCGSFCGGGYKNKPCQNIARATPDFNKAWGMVLEDGRLKSIRRKLSIHELRQLFYVAVEGLCGPPEVTGLPFKEKADPFTDYVLTPNGVLEDKP